MSSVITVAVSLLHKDNMCFRGIFTASKYGKMIMWGTINGYSVVYIKQTNLVFFFFFFLKGTLPGAPPEN